jgi:alkylation response protein AidB-like acyl-CoA dehydrogenase
MRVASQYPHQDEAADTDHVASAGQEEIERRRELPEPIVAALIERGLFRLLLPRALSGAELCPAVYVEVIREVAKHDASTAWCWANVRCDDSGLLGSGGAGILAASAASSPGSTSPAGRERYRAAGSAEPGASPAAAITRAGSARMCRSSGPTGRRSGGPMAAR